MRLRGFVCLLLIAQASGCSSKTGSAKPESSQPARGGKKGLTFATDVMPVEVKPVTYVVTSPGHIEAFERVQVTARVAGAIDRVAFAEGQSVKRGQVLVMIDSDRYLAAVNSAKAALD